MHVSAEFPVEPPQIVDVSAQGNVKFSLWVSFLEIYNESAYDLLEHVGKKTAARIPLPLKEDRNGMPYVKGTLTCLLSVLYSALVSGTYRSNISCVFYLINS